MRIGSALTLFFFLSSIAQVSAADKCALKQIAWLDFALTRGGLPAVTVKLQGRKAQLIIDTGNGFSLIDGAFVTAAGLAPRPSNRPAELGEGGSLGSVRLASVSLGEVKLAKAYDFYVRRGAAMGWGPGVAGTIGLNILQDIDLELDMARRKVGFYLQKHCRGKVVYWAPEWVEISLKQRRNDRSATVDLDGKKLVARLDTGMAETVLDLEAAARLFALMPSTRGLETASEIMTISGKRLGSYRARFKKLALDGIEVHGPTIRVADLAEGEIALGMQHLQYLHLYFAYGEWKVYATAAHATFPDKSRQATRPPKPIVR